MAPEEIHFDEAHYFWQETHHSPAAADYAFKLLLKRGAKVLMITDGVIWHIYQAEGEE